MTPAEVCRKAVERIQEHGWCQRSLGNCDGPVCIIGAIRSVTGGWPNAELSEAGVQAFFMVEKVVGLKGRLHHWNDRPTRTVEDVIQALLKAADALEAP